MSKLKPLMSPKHFFLFEWSPKMEIFWRIDPLISKDFVNNDRLWATAG
jgi:hypothetical protein